MIATILLQASSGLQMPIMLGLMMLVMYFFMIRPQMKKSKEAKKLIEELKKGDKVITTAGIHGRIVDMNETTFLIEVEGGVKIRFDKSAIALEPTKAIQAKAA